MRKLVFGGVALGALTIALGAASAQTPQQPSTPTTTGEQPAAATPEREEGDRVVVTGSLIARDEFSTTSPVQIITTEESTLAGLASTTEILQSTSATGGNNQINNYFGGFVVDGGPGVNSVSLRGLGATRTLVLLNGRRITPAGTRGSVGSADLNVLPNAMIDRIEILKDGASSIYGSDAVAGVINVITHSEMEGFTLETQGNFTEHGGGEQFSASISAGYSDVNYRISGSFEYYEREPLRLREREWTLCNTDSWRDPDTGESLDYIEPITGKPKCYPISTTGSNGVTINTLGTPSFAGVGAPGSTPGAGGAFNRWRPNSGIQSGLVGWEGVGGNINVRDTFDPDHLNQTLVSPAETLTGFLQGGFDIGMLGNAELYFETLITERKSSQTGYRQLSLDYPTGSPLIPANIAAIPGNFLGPQPTAPYNIKARAFIGFGNYESWQDVLHSRWIAGLRGDFMLPDWSYDVYASYSKSDGEYTFEQFLTDRVIGSMTGCPVTAPAGCVVAPPLNSATVGGNLPAAFVDYIVEPVTGTTKYDETAVSALFTGPLFELPAGQVAGAFGMEWRTAEIDDTPSIHMQNSNLYNFSTATPTRGEDSVWEIFGEVEIPLLSGLPGIEDLTFNGSARYTDYDSYGGDETYKAGLVYHPIDWIMVRASFGTSYRAPALFEQFLGGTTGFAANTTDPCHDYGSRNPSTIRYQNCHAELNNPAFLATQSVRVITAGGAAQGLSAETSENTSVGIVFEPPMPESFGDLSFAIDWYDIEVSDQVSRVGRVNLTTLCYDDPDFRAGGGYCNFSTREPANNNRFTVFDNYINQATQIVEGYDYNLRYVRDIGPGTFRTNLEITQYVTQADKLFDTDPLDELNGTINFPELTGQVDLTYDWGNYRLFWRTNWIQGTDSYGYLEEDPATSIFDFDVNDYYTHSLSLRYRSENEWEFTAGVRNLFDQTPPTISSGFYNRVGNAPLYSGYDYVGRQVYVNVSKHF